MAGLSLRVHSLALKALVSGGILSFTRALGEFGATLMFAGNIPGKHKQHH